MKTNKGFGILGVVILLAGILVIGGGAYYVVNKSNIKNFPENCGFNGELCIKNSTFNSQEDTQTIGDTSDGPFTINSAVSINKNDVIDQPAYLINAYENKGKKYVDVDYVEWFNDPDLSLKAQVEDGRCQNTEDCYAFPNGYKRNKNPLIRTFEIDPNVLIDIHGNLLDNQRQIDGVPSQQYNEYVSNVNNQKISLDKFISLVSSITPYAISKPPFKAERGFIVVDVKNDKVVKITEPYQE
jgi:hypothetical protein